VATTPNYSAVSNGLPVDLSAVNHAAHISQFVGTHNLRIGYNGARKLSPLSGDNLVWYNPSTLQDVSQPITMSGTVMGRVLVPLLPVGNGGDVLVSLYSNSAGSPNIAAGALAQTLVPAGIINTLAAPTGLTDAGPGALPQNNTYYLSGGTVTSTIAPPVGDSIIMTALSSGCFTYSGDYIIGAGGDNGVSSTNKVFTYEYLGGGALSQATFQPSLPVGASNATVITTSDTIVFAGGQTLSGGVYTHVNNVFVASWDSNQGIIGQWSAASSLPTAVAHAGGASYNNTVYVVGGDVTGPTPANTVYYATISNGHIGSWVTGPALQQKLTGAFVTVVDSWLVVSGGIPALAGTGTSSTAVYYTPINADGTLTGSWQVGSPLPTGVDAYDITANAVSLGGTATCIIGGYNTVVGTVSPVNETLIQSGNSYGFNHHWVTNKWTITSSVSGPNDLVGPSGAFDNGDGSWDVVAIMPVNGDSTDIQYQQVTFTPVPAISIPLVATGLTNGAVYHIVFTQVNQVTENDYVSIPIANGSYSSDALVASRHGTSWSTLRAGYSVPVVVYDNQANVVTTDTAGNFINDSNVYHIWADPDAGNSGSGAFANLASRWSYIGYSYANLPLLMSDTTVHSTSALNVNPTFASGVSNWTPVNCTFTQSSAHVHGGYLFSGLITPNGTSATVYVESEKENIPINLASSGAPNYVYVSGWLYSALGTSSFSLSTNWYDSASVYLSTSNTIVSLPATTWTFVGNWFAVPSGASRATVVPTLGGTPSAANLLYLSDIRLNLSPELTRCTAAVSTVSYVNRHLPSLIPQLL